MFESEYKQKHSLETAILGILGVAICHFGLFNEAAHHLNSIQETIVLVIALGGIMGITHIELPRTIAGKTRTAGQSVFLGGVISAFMDSFLVLLMIKKDRLTGSEEDTLKYRVYATHSALIGGLMLYFGEVYALPLALQYNMREWHSMLPIAPPAIIFLAVLALLTKRLSLTVETAEPGKVHADTGDYLEFAGVIILLLVTHNAMLVLGVLLTYASVTGQGHDLLHVFKTETEMSVMMLLILAAFIIEPMKPYVAHFTGYLALAPTVGNGVITGAMFPTSGDAWLDMSILSTGVLVLPISSLVGVMLFQTKQDWIGYVKTSIPLTLLWFALVTGWFKLVWPHLDDTFYQFFARPHL